MALNPSHHASNGHHVNLTRCIPRTAAPRPHSVTPARLTRIDSNPMHASAALALPA